MCRFLTCLLLLLVAPALALASPVSYAPAPLDTVQAAVSTLAQAINNSQAPAAYLSTASGTTTATTTTQRFTVTVTGLTTAASTTSAAMTVTNADVAANSQLICQVNAYAGTTGVPIVSGVAPAAGSVAFTISNVSTSAALNGNVPVACLVFN